MRRSDHCKLSVAVLSLVLCFQAAGGSMKDERIIDDVAYTRPSVLVNVDNGRRLNLYCTGSGMPIVIFEAGLGDSTKAWGLVQPEVSKHTKACSYDRAGLGFSDASDVPGTAGNAEKDLGELLRVAKLPPPYILVGHSYGALILKLFTFENQKDVAALVLVDPSHEDIGKNIFAIHPEHHAENKQYLTDLRKCLVADSSRLAENGDLNSLCVGKAGPRYSEAINAADGLLAAQQARIAAWTSEMTNVWRESSDQVRNASRSLGDMPLVLLRSSPPKTGPKETSEQREKKNTEVARLHASTVALSTQGKSRVMHDSGHYIQLDEPSAVIEAVVNMVQDYSLAHPENER